MVVRLCILKATVHAWHLQKQRPGRCGARGTRQCSLAVLMSAGGRWRSGIVHMHALCIPVYVHKMCVNVGLLDLAMIWLWVAASFCAGLLCLFWYR